MRKPRWQFGAPGSYGKSSLPHSRDKWQDWIELGLLQAGGLDSGSEDSGKQGIK